MHSLGLNNGNSGVGEISKEGRMSGEPIVKVDASPLHHSKLIKDMPVPGHHSIKKIQGFHQIGIFGPPPFLTMVFVLFIIQCLRI